MGLSKTQRIAILLAIDTAFFLLEIIVGYAVHSLALVADAFHMFNDILSLLVGLWAVRVATNSKASKTYTYGWQRAETLGALVNGVFLVALCVTIVLEAIQRFVEPPEIQSPKLVLIVGACGLASNLLGLVLFHEHGHGHGHSHGHGGGGGHSHESAVEEGQAGPTTSTKSTGGLGQENGDSARPGVQESSVPGGASSAIADDRSLSPVDRRTSRSARRSSASRPMFTDAQDIPATASGIRQSFIQAGSYGGAEYHHGSDRVPDNIEESPERQSSNTDQLLGGGGGGGGGKLHSNYGSIEPTGSAHGHSHDENEESSGHGHSHGGHGHSHGDLNMRGILLHVLGDALGNVGVIASALFIWLTRFSWRFYADPLISLIITVIILCSAIPLCRATSRILLQGVPPWIDIDAIRADIESLDHIVSCHHLHVWQLSDSKMVASLHVQIEFRPENGEAPNVQSKRARELYMNLAKEIHLLLHNHGIDSSTIQPEFCTDTSHRHLVSRSSGEQTIVGDADENAPVVADAAETCLLECDASCGNSVSGQCCDPVIAGAGSGAAVTPAASGSDGSRSPAHSTHAP